MGRGRGPEMAAKDDSGIVMREDLKGDEKPDEKASGSTNLVKLRSPSGAKVETSEENAETLRGAGYT
jgi:hypothetical protein